MSAICKAAVSPTAVVSTLQIGLEWFPDGVGGGSSRFFSTLCDHLIDECVTVRGIAAGRNVSSKDRINEGVRVICRYDAPILERLRAARLAVREIVAAGNVDLVASHFALFTAASLDIVRRLPLVVHFHGPWAAESRLEGASFITASGRFLLEKTVYSRASAAIVLSHAFGDVLHRSYGIPRENIRVIPGGVDTRRFNMSTTRAQARLRLGLPLNRPIIVTVRRLAKRMGLETLIAAFKEAGKKHTDALLVIVGAGHLHETLRRCVEEYDLGDRVVFAGRVPEEDLPYYYRAADFSIVPSVALEGFGLVVAESLACGTPAIVSPVGGLPEVVDGLRGDLILENTGTAAVAHTLCAVLSGARRLPTSDECASYAQARFSWPIIANEIRAVYEAAL